jgi:hypothetical protein
MVSTLQLTRLTRLRLAHRDNKICRIKKKRLLDGITGSAEWKRKDYWTGSVDQKDKKRNGFFRHFHFLKL